MKFYSTFLELKSNKNKFNSQKTFLFQKLTKLLNKEFNKTIFSFEYKIREIKKYDDEIWRNLRNARAQNYDEWHRVLIKMGGTSGAKFI